MRKMEDRMPIFKKQIPVVPKNFDGHLGIICNYCGGYGFTNNLSGGSGGCQKCGGSGIEPINIYELAKKVDKLTELVEKLIKK